MKSKITHFGAIGFALASFTFWVFADVAVKLAGESALPSYEILGFLGLFIVVFMLAYGVWRGEVKALWPVSPQRQFFRACLDLGNYLLIVIALRHVPLTLFYILVFTAPMAIALLAALFLREHLEWRKATAIFMGFIGVVIAVDPFGTDKQGDWIGYGACFLGVACFAVNMVWSRTMTQTERSDSLTFFSGLVSAVGGFGMMLWHAEPVSFSLLVLLGAMGLFSTLGNVCSFIALKHTTAANVSQYHYTQLITGAGIGYLVWHEQPNLAMLIGSVFIIGSGLYIAARSR
jgi:drug/metabolite transporter (DMT)-like permease